MSQIDFYATDAEIAELARRYTVTDVRAARSRGGGWYVLPDGFVVRFNFLRAVVEQWIEREHGGIYLRIEGTYEPTVIHLGVAPDIPAAEQHRGPYGGIYPMITQIPREHWIQVTHGLTAGMVREADAGGEIGDGEDHGDSVRENAERWGLR